MPIDLLVVGMPTARKTSTAGCSRNDAVSKKKKAIDIGTANLIIARLGGALHRNERECVGPQTLLRGLRRFNDIAFGFALRKGVVVNENAIE